MRHFDPTELKPADFTATKAEATVTVGHLVRQDPDLVPQYLQSRRAMLLKIPKIENIHQKVYKAASRRGALNMAAWHYCGSTHCRAGWVVTLAGEAGQRLEACFGTGMAARLIYTASDPEFVYVGGMFSEAEHAALLHMKNSAKREAKRNL